jgi:hypothetical protein
MLLFQKIKTFCWLVHLLLSRVKQYISANTGIYCSWKIKFYARNIDWRQDAKRSATMKEENVRILLRIEKKF